MPRLSIDSPLGRLTLREEDGRLTAIDWRGKHTATDETPLLLQAKRQLAAYFAGERRTFDLPLAPAGPSLEPQLWRARPRPRRRGARHWPSLRPQSPADRHPMPPRDGCRGPPRRL